jgi:hypothetical protein
MLHRASDLLNVAQKGPVAGSFEHGNAHSGSVKGGDIFD